MPQPITLPVVTDACKIVNWQIFSRRSRSPPASLCKQCFRNGRRIHSQYFPAPTILRILSIWRDISRILWKKSRVTWDMVNNKKSVKFPTYCFLLLNSKLKREKTYVPSRNMRTTSKVQPAHTQSLYYTNIRKFSTCLNHILPIKFHFAKLYFAPSRFFSS